MATEGVFLHLGVYPAPAGAEADYEDLKKLHGEGRVGSYDAAVVTKDADGKVHVHKHEKSTRRGAWTGVAAGAALGAVFPPSIIGTALVGGVAGGLIGHVRNALSHADMEELGEALPAGEAALLVVGSGDMEWQVERVLSRANRRLVKELDLKHKDFAKALAEAEQQ